MASAYLSDLVKPRLSSRTFDLKLVFLTKMSSLNRAE